MMMKLFWLLTFLLLGACGDAGRERGTTSTVVENRIENGTALVSQEIPDFSDQEPIVSLRAGGDEWDLSDFTPRALILPGIVDLGQINDPWVMLFPRISLVQVRILAGPESPVKHVNMAVVFSNNPVPVYFETDTRGYSPAYYVQTGIGAKVYLVWDELIVPEGADDYEKSRNKGFP
ncbi:hypothetical protein [Pseudomonas sp. URMO17WK12:I12]|jgi:hypothetical protein|uniref:hypothetical protein n=1 Tax=Pseudomonas sp. URMO17WK12:I12 TaxID=1259797 RepID=UPI000486C3D7|nr:hypothetical protein [Pseudomonas sp. URMO17WK12:I12]